MQTLFGWSDAHPHRFVIAGTEYGAHSPGAAGRARLGDLGLRERERFSYEYNFPAPWRVDLRVEQITAASPERAYPRCAGGRRAGPPEGWDGPWDYLERTQPHLVFAAAVRAAEILGELLDADPDATVAEVLLDDGYDELKRLSPLLGLERFDRRARDQTLREPATGAQKTIIERGRQ